MLVKLPSVANVVDAELADRALAARRLLSPRRAPPDIAPPAEVRSGRSRRGPEAGPAFRVAAWLSPRVRCHPALPCI